MTGVCDGHSNHPELLPGRHAYAPCSFDDFSRHSFNAGYGVTHHGQEGIQSQRYNGGNHPDLSECGQEHGQHGEARYGLKNAYRSHDRPSQPRSAASKDAQRNRCRDSDHGRNRCKHDMLAGSEPQLGESIDHEKEPVGFAHSRSAKAANWSADRLKSSFTTFVAGWRSSSSLVPTCSTFPSCRTAIRSPNVRASKMS